MLGRDSAYSGTKTAQIQATPTPSANVKPSGKASEADAISALPFWLIGGVALYFLWAIIEQHQRVKSAIQPKQIGINLRNLLVIMVTVVLGLNLFKVGAAKLSAALTSWTGGRIRLRWLVYLAGNA